MSWFSGVIDTGVDKVIDAVGDTLDNLFTSDDERLKAKNVLETLRNKLKSELIQAFTVVIEAKKAIIIAEMGGNWLQKSWRPLLMLMFGFIIANEYIIAPYVQALFDTTLPARPISADMWAVLKLGIGGYVGGRSLEKAVEAWNKRK